MPKISLSNNKILIGTAVTFIIGIYGCDKKSDASTSPPIPAVIIPVTPTGLTGKPTSGTQASLTWIDNSTSEKGFKVQRKTASTVFSDIATVGVDITTYNDNAVTMYNKYTYRVYAYNDAGPSVSYSNEFTISIGSCPPKAEFNSTVNYGNMADQDGNVYKTLTIGSQIWMAENLRTGRFRNGDVIPVVTATSDWVALDNGNNKKPGSCWYANDSALNDCRYGRIYNFYAIIDSRKICPVGWHIPTLEEWNTMFTVLGGTTSAGMKLKSSMGWLNNSNGNNSSGFTALPGGYRWDGRFYSQGEYCSIWYLPSSPPATGWGAGSGQGYVRLLSNTGNVYVDRIYQGVNDQSTYVRCIKD